MMYLLWVGPETLKSPDWKVVKVIGSCDNRWLVDGLCSGVSWFGVI